MTNKHSLYGGPTKAEESRAEVEEINQFNIKNKEGSRGALVNKLERKERESFRYDLLDDRQ